MESLPANFAATCRATPARCPHTIFNDIRIGKRFNIGERMKLDGMMDVFNAWNRLNVADVNVIWTNAGQPTASFDPRRSSSD